jgi:hypothetical protein
MDCVDFHRILYKTLINTLSNPIWDLTSRDGGRWLRGGYLNPCTPPPQMLYVLHEPTHKMQHKTVQIVYRNWLLLHSVI